MSTSSLLQTALQNLHLNQQLREQSHTPQPGSYPTSPPDSDYDEDGGEQEEDSGDGDGQVLVKVGKGTAPGTPVPGRGMVLGQRVSGLGMRGKDPLRTFPTHVAVRIFLQLDVKTLARCDRNRALVLPRLSDLPGSTGKVRKTGDDTPEFYDPYDKTPRLSALKPPPLPSNPTPQWTKAESKKAWKTNFHQTLKRSDPNAEPEVDPLRVDIESLQSSGTSTPNGRHSYAGLGSGGASKWMTDEGGSLTPGERKVMAREGYKALGGRKSRMKRKMGGEFGSRDKTGAAVVDDGRFDAPW